MTMAIAFMGVWLYVIASPAPPLLDNVPFSTLIVDRHGKVLRMGLAADQKYRERTSLAHIPPHVQKAALLYEDRYFYQHPGVNPLSMLRAAWSTFTGGRRMGGSTIAMQVARLRYNLVTRTITGKIHQMFLALRLVHHYGHDAVLEAYFQLAPYGGNIEGIGAAARVYFHQSVTSITPVQALALSVIPQNPTKRMPRQGKDSLPNNALQTARTMLHHIWNEAYLQQAVPHTPPPLHVFTPSQMPMGAPHVSMELLEQAKKSEQPPTTLHTTIDPMAQGTLEQIVRQFTARGRQFGITNAAAMLLHWPTMETRALVGSANFYDGFIAGQVDGTRAKRSPGSTLKPFIYALALEQGLIHPQTVLIDSPHSFGDYDPENFDLQFQGPLPAHEALRKSRNIPAAWLAARIDPDLYTLLKRSQVELQHDYEHYGLSLVLGGGEVSMRELVSLYAMLANGGVWQPMRLHHSSNDNAVDTATPILSPEAALVTLHMLEQKTTSSQHGAPIPLRFKTGTSNGYRDAWTVGIVGPYVLAVWVGNFDNTANPLFVGNKVAVPLFEDLARALTLQEPLQDPLANLHESLNLTQLNVCRDTGDIDTSLCRDIVSTWFIPGRSPIKDSGVYRQIWIDPATGLRLCGPAPHAKRVTWEFWPSELYALFLQAGLHKPVPPPFAESCLEKMPASDILTKTAPYIQSPKEGVVYHYTPNGSEQNLIPLTANANTDVQNMFWFVGSAFVGTSTPSTPLLWPARAGEHLVRVVDDFGRSHTRILRVNALQ